MTQAERVIRKCGGVKVVAGYLNLPYAQVYAWKIRRVHRGSGYIPAHFQTRLLVAARRDGKDLSFDDFFDVDLVLAQGSAELGVA